MKPSVEPAVSETSVSTLADALNKAFSKAFTACNLDPELGYVTLSQRPELSQYQCNGAFNAARTAKKNPRVVAEQVLNQLKDCEIISSLTVDGPGFINIKLTDEFLLSQAKLVQSADYTRLLPDSAKKPSVIDFGGPNVAKPMHVGHLRSTLIGDSLQRLFRFLGVPIESDIHMGDWGTQMGMLICETQRHFPSLTYFDGTFEGPYPSESPVTIADLEVFYPEASARCKSDPAEMLKAQKALVELQAGRKGYRALWQHFVDISISALKHDFAELDVFFDQWFGESHYHDRIPALLKRVEATGCSQLSDGAVIVPFGEDEPPLMLVKSDGGYGYATSDVATVEERVDVFKLTQLFYVVDKRQSLHFHQVFETSRKTGIAGPDITMEHLAFGTMNGADGRPFKTRAGGVMKLKDLISLAKDEALTRMAEMPASEGYNETERAEISTKVALAALKFGDLMHDRVSDYIFDLGKFTRFEGKTGPYVLYAAVRIKSILKKATQQGLTIGHITVITGPERDLILELCRFPDALREAHARRMPSVLCEFAFNVAQMFNRFYLQCHILSESDQSLQSSWLGLLQFCVFELETTLNLLGISVPEQM